MSYPQCPATSLPSSISFGIVGVNDGIVYSPNPCMSTEYTWATTSSTSNSEPHVSFHANTADPGPSLSSYWPSNDTTPMDCATDVASNPSNPNSYACNYDYGWLLIGSHHGSTRSWPPAKGSNTSTADR